jgi:hypothetical protein
MRAVESAGTRVGQALDAIDGRLDSPVKAAALGIAMAVGVIGAGIATFLIVLSLLVRLFTQEAFP